VQLFFKRLAIETFAKISLGAQFSELFAASINVFPLYFSTENKITKHDSLALLLQRREEIKFSARVGVLSSHIFSLVRKCECGALADWLLFVTWLRNVHSLQQQLCKLENYLDNHVLFLILYFNMRVSWCANNLYFLKNK